MLNRSKALLAAAVTVIAVTLETPGASADAAAEQNAQWPELRRSVFGDRPDSDGLGVVALDTPDRAEDASLVPVGFRSSRPQDIKEITRPRQRFASYCGRGVKDGLGAALYRFHAK